MGGVLSKKREKSAEGFILPLNRLYDFAQLFPFTSTASAKGFYHRTMHIDRDAKNSIFGIRKMPLDRRAKLGRMPSPCRNAKEKFREVTSQEGL